MSRSIIKHITLVFRSSAGVALYPSDGVTISELLKNADQALYNVKINNRNNVGFFKDIKL